ncbi:hypothetical protein L596_025359 [Steinernema carpocapsae]|uniref:Uncharacterized protein n=1 Tax=Steinernema carpocapsae TaxID=34508 RepID=A0A4U5M7Q6_STECR|nr:hypothetical protein L596_025359 [Steinernema carpocapsae]
MAQIRIGNYVATGVTGLLASLVFAFICFMVKVTYWNYLWDLLKNDVKFMDLLNFTKYPEKELWLLGIPMGAFGLISSYLVVYGIVKQNPNCIRCFSVFLFLLASCLIYVVARSQIWIHVFPNAVWQQEPAPETFIVAYNCISAACLTAAQIVSYFFIISLKAANNIRKPQYVLTYY